MGRRPRLLTLAGLPVTWWQLTIVLGMVGGVLALLRVTILRPGLKVISTTEVRLLRELLAEFRPNSGSTMRDALDRIEKAAVRLERHAATAAATGASTSAGIDRIEAAAASVAADLTEAHGRADATTGEPAGAAADAASKSV